jgi:hypothetical protein
MYLVKPKMPLRVLRRNSLLPTKNPSDPQRTDEKKIRSFSALLNVLIKVNLRNIQYNTIIVKLV